MQSHRITLRAFGCLLGTASEAGQDARWFVRAYLVILLLAPAKQGHLASIAQCHGVSMESRSVVLSSAVWQTGRQAGRQLPAYIRCTSPARNRRRAAEYSAPSAATVCGHLRSADTVYRWAQNGRSSGPYPAWHALAAKSAAARRGSDLVGTLSGPSRLLLRTQVLR
jgi:hypothetical protein